MGTMLFHPMFLYDAIWGFIYAFVVGLALTAIFLGGSLSPPALVFLSGLFACFTILL